MLAMPLPHLRRLLRFLLTPCVIAFVLATLGGNAVAAPEAPDVAQARELLDTYYGDRHNLEQAAVLLKRAYDRDPKDADVYVQAGRATIMGAFVGLGRYEAGSREAYGALLDRALALDPKHAKAHILKSEVFAFDGRREEELRELDTAKALGTSDPWLDMGYARYYRSIRKTSEAYSYWGAVQARGPGATASDHKAYVTALWHMCGIRLEGEDMVKKVREFGAIALRERHPADAYTPANWSEFFVDYELFDDAIAYARVALQTMSFGAGRSALAMGLYGKAAQQLMAGRPMNDPEVQALLKEARSLRIPRQQLLPYFLEYRGFKGSLEKYRGVMEEIVL